MLKLTHERLLATLRYEPETGAFFWRVRAAHRRMPGEKAGSPSADGRNRIRIDGELFYAYRLAWFYMTGAWPAALIDHRDGDQTNDRWENLRDVSQTLNMQNQRRAPRSSRSGVLGAHKTKRGTFEAWITVDRRGIYLGTHATAEAAHEAYVEAKRRLHPGGNL